MILIIAAKHNFQTQTQLSVAVSEKYFLTSMAKVFSFSKLLQQ